MKIKWEEILKKNYPTTHLLFNIRILVYKLTTIQTNSGYNSPRGWR